MKRAYTNGILLDGTEQMQPVAHKILLTEDDKITAIADEAFLGCSQLTIHAPAGSYAETYAKNHSIPFAAQ